MTGAAVTGAAVTGVATPPGFEWMREGRLHALVRSDVRGWLVPLLHAAHDGWGELATQPLCGGRGGACIVPAHDVVVRPYRHGGLPARLLHDTYVGWQPRPFRELYVTATLQARGAPVVEVYGAAVVWLFPGCYRGWLATRYVHQARTLWEWLQSGPIAADRAVGLQRVGAALKRLHACGARHPDLNANNILLGPPTGSAGGMDVYFIDFDRARLGAAVGDSADLARLWRSLQKLDAAACHVTPADFEALRLGYAEAPACG